MTRSLRGRLALALGLTAVIALVASALITFGLVRRYTAEQVTEELTRTARAVAARGGDQLAVDAARFRAYRQALEVSGHLLATIGPGGNVVAETAEMKDIAAAIDIPAALAGRNKSGFVQVEDTRYAYVVLPRRVTRRGLLAAVIVAKPAGVTWSPILARVLLGAGVAALLGGAAATVLARRLARPVQHVAAATTRIASGDLHTRVPVEGTDELAGLARSFNGMAATLEEARRREGEFLASISHELRTPITAIRGYIEALDEAAVRDQKGRREALGVIKTETARLERLVADVMDLARAGAQGFRLELRDADLVEVLREAATAHAAESSEAGVSIELASNDPLLVRTDPVRVRQIVTNLVENAVRVSPPGAVVRLAGHASPDKIVIEVTDEGPGIAPEHLPHVFERAYLRNVGAANGDDAPTPPEPGRLRAGSGLGLAIVRELVRALSGSVNVTSEPGRGTTFSVALPRR